MAQPIRALPHLLIAGTSGNGKSMFFNQALISLTKTSPHIQLYLLDLKLGLEVRAYSDLPNVRIAKDSDEAVNLLQVVVNEMMERFKYLEKNGYKIIDPVRDSKDLIVVGVDEDGAESEPTNEIAVPGVALTVTPSPTPTASTRRSERPRISTRLRRR